MANDFPFAILMAARLHTRQAVSEVQYIRNPRTLLSYKRKKARI